MKIKTFIFLLIIAGLDRCTNDQVMTIKPIDQEFNTRLIDAKTLDSRLYSTKDLLQYFEVFDYDGVEPEIIQQKIDSFINTNYKLENIVFNELTIMFYKHDAFIDYTKYVYEAARDTDTGMIPDQNDNLLSRVAFLQDPSDKSRVLRTIIIYDNNEMILELKDTLRIKDRH